MGISGWLRRRGRKEEKETSSLGTDAVQKQEEPEETPAASKESGDVKQDSPRGLFARLKEGLSRTRSSFVARVDSLLSTHKRIDEELFEELEEVLIQADVGVDTTLRLVDAVREKIKAGGITDPEEVRPILRETILEILTANTAPLELPEDVPAVIMVVGVNGAGKTTTIAKLAHRFKSQGKRVILGAADTFRAAAIEQLEIWANRVGVEIVKHQPGADPAAVAFDTIQAGRARGCDVVIIDTAGRLQTKTNLMKELEKIGRVVERELQGRTPEVLLVVDATTGQNALSQAKLFSEAVSVTGVVLTKLDGTAKGGIIIAIAEELGLPVKLIGIGEAYDDLRDFDPEDFVAALFDA
ncbi:MAG: signal recognition particle-docking protein FtsY [Firmicutes bacterium]|jgi:fused signal recognition particle receptor|nr:signal recognition particle-docking protein FtsY [Bacillota bacterium]